MGIALPAMIFLLISTAECHALTRESIVLLQQRAVTHQSGSFQKHSRPAPITHNLENYTEGNAEDELDKLRREVNELRHQLGTKRPEKFSDPSLEWNAYFENEPTVIPDECARKQDFTHRWRKCLDTSQQRTLSAWLIFSVLVLVYEFTRKDGANDVPRDGRWDHARFWCMFFVVMGHVSAAWFVAVPHNSVLTKLLFRTRMPGFSLISGVFSASGVIYEPDADQALLSRSRITRFVRDLAMINFTIIPVLILIDVGQPLIENHHLAPDKSGLYVLKELTNVPLLYEPHFWYLGCLFMWMCFTPILCLLRYPVTTSVALAVLSRSAATVESVTIVYFPFFVLGFSMGGGLMSQDRKSYRKWVEDWLADRRILVVSLAWLLSNLALIVLSIDLPDGINYILFAKFDDHSNLPTQWSEGGWLIDALRIYCCMSQNLAFISVCFALSLSSTLSVIGTRTLYIYVLHIPLIREWKTLRTAAIELFAPESNEQEVYMAACVAFLTCCLLGSRLVVDTLHNFVQPQWLVDILMPTPDSRKERQESSSTKRL